MPDGSVQAARVSAEAVAAAVGLTNDCIKDGNAVEATSKAAASAWRSGQARRTLRMWPRACARMPPACAACLACRLRGLCSCWQLAHDDCMQPCACSARVPHAFHAARMTWCSSS